MSAHLILAERELDVPPARAARLVVKKRVVRNVRDEVRLPDHAGLSTLAAEVIVLTGEAIRELVVAVEDEVRACEGVDRYRSAGDTEVSDILTARRIEVLMPRIQWNPKERAGSPFEVMLLAAVRPDGGSTTPLENVDHLLEHLALRCALFSWRNLHHVTVVGDITGVVVDVGAAYIPTSPRLHFHSLEVFDVRSLDQGDAFALDKFGVGTSTAKHWGCSHNELLW